MDYAAHMSAALPSVYLMGHNDHERRRLSLQASVLNPLTRGFLQRAGLSAGMRVLDLGAKSRAPGFDQSLLTSAATGVFATLPALDLRSFPRCFRSVTLPSVATIPKGHRVVALMNLRTVTNSEVTGQTGPLRERRSLATSAWARTTSGSRCNASK
jgi:hypothetical protein